MKPRFASKVVARVKSGTVTASSYSRQTVVAAFKQQGEPLEEHLLKPWDDADAERQRRREENEARIGQAKARKAERIAAAEARHVERDQVRAQKAAEAREAQNAVAVEKQPSQVTLIVSGWGAQDAFRHEAGGQRVPPTEKRGRVHTSTATTVTAAVLLVSKQKNLRIDPRDLEWKICRGSGPEVSTGTSPTPPCSSPTCPRARWSAARTSGASTRIRRWPSTCCAAAWPRPSRRRLSRAGTPSGGGRSAAGCGPTRGGPSHFSGTR